MVRSALIHCLGILMNGIISLEFFLVGWGSDYTINHLSASGLIPWTTFMTMIVSETFWAWLINWLICYFYFWSHSWSQYCKLASSFCLSPVKSNFRDWRCGSLVDSLPTMYEALDSVSTSKSELRKKREVLNGLSEKNEEIWSQLVLVRSTHLLKSLPESEWKNRECILFRDNSPQVSPFRYLLWAEALKAFVPDCLPMMFVEWTPWQCKGSLVSIPSL